MSARACAVGGQVLLFRGCKHARLRDRCCCTAAVSMRGWRTGVAVLRLQACPVGGQVQGGTPLENILTQQPCCATRRYKQAGGTERAWMAGVAVLWCCGVAQRFKLARKAV
eukprot:360230-Chlamydomonas_euryale.AAC.2